MKTQSLRNSWIGNGILIAIILIIKFATSPAWIEKVYATVIYPPIGAVLRKITGWLPFSLGDIFYGGIAIVLLATIIRFVRNLYVRKDRAKLIKSGLTKLVGTLLAAYLIFLLFWGLNYERLGIAYQLQLKNGRYDTAELISLTESLVQKVNDTRKQMGGFDYRYPEYKEIVRRTENAYKEAEKVYPFLHYKTPSIKKSLYAWFGNYMGFTGYYNPFTGEAQINMSAPECDVPFIACHEAAHQIGYGDESEANFVGYLAASVSHDTLFQYSTYFAILRYANRELYLRDSATALNNYRNLDTLVRYDLQKVREYSLKYKNPVEPYINYLYGIFLKAHNQPQGIDTYNEVTGWLIALQKRMDSKGELKENVPTVLIQK